MTRFFKKPISGRQAAGLNQREVSKRLALLSFLSIEVRDRGKTDRLNGAMDLLQLAELYGKPPEFFLRD